MRIAICGIRGIHACYGGFETFDEELSSRLVKRGHQVLVYGRKHVINYKKPEYKGVQIRLLPAPKQKYLETPVHTLLCIGDLIFRRPVDVVLVCNAANSPFLWLLRLFRIPVAVNVDGIERERKKWNALGRLWYRLGEFTSTIFPNIIISDADMIRRYYQQRYRKESRTIPYGFSLAKETEVELKMADISSLYSQLSTQKLFEELAIKPGKYFLYVSRLEPENNADLVIKSFEALKNKADYKLVIVGDAPYANSYKKKLKALAGEQVVFTGYRFGEDYQLLQLGAFAYIQATEVGGTHPALVESMGFGNCIIANQTEEHVEVLKDAGKFYKKNDEIELQKCLEELINKPDRARNFQKLARNRALQNYNWDKIVSDYERLFRELDSL
jgi:glycosyltransferase involved in cell wall biosynthesis